MPYKSTPIEKFSVEPGYNDLARTEKEVHANALEVAESMEAQGDNPELYPIKYAKGDDGEYFTRNHATLKAAQMRNKATNGEKWTHLVAIESPHERGSAADLLDLIHSNNQGHPLDRIAQGRIYNALAAGVAHPDSTAEAPKWIREPMSNKEIGEACKPTDYTAEHVNQCRVLADSSPEIQLLLENEKVSANIVITAKQLAKGDEAKQLKILKRAITYASEQGDDKATKKHFDAIKPEFVTLKAAAPTGGVPEKSKTGNKSGDGDGEPSDLELESETQPPAEAPNLFAQSGDDVAPAKISAKGDKKLIADLAALFVNDEALAKIGVTMTLADDEAEALAIEVVKTYRASTSIL